jgi:hypothetical protein
MWAHKKEPVSRTTHCWWVQDTRGPHRGSTPGVHTMRKGGAELPHAAYRLTMHFRSPSPTVASTGFRFFEIGTDSPVSMASST